MPWPRRFVAIIVFAACPALLAGCDATGMRSSLRTQALVEGDLTGAPAWVAQQRGDDAHTVWGVGDCRGLNSDVLARKTALARARDTIARALVEETHAMLADYRAHSGAKIDIDVISAEVGRIDLSDLPESAAWTARDGACYVLVGLPCADFKTRVAAMDQLAPDVRQALVERADRQVSERNARAQNTDSGGGGLHTDAPEIH